MEYRSHSHRRGGIAAILAGIILVTCHSSNADMEFPGDPVPLSQVMGKPGSYRVTLAERSPLSAPAAIVKRMHIKEEAPADYDWAKEVYDLYVPKEPAEGAKYGLMIGSVFKDYGAPPGDWGEALEKHHVIWICSESVGDGQSAERRVGTMLDAAWNVKKAFAIRDDRTYASVGSWRGPVSGVALHYPDVFDGGALYTVGWEWFGKLNTAKGAIWTLGEMTRPDADRLEAAKRGRFFFVARKEDIRPEADKLTDIVKRGYPNAGIINLKMITVPAGKMGHYGLYDPDIFEQGITFLDASIDKLPPKIPQRSTGANATPTATVDKPTALKPADGISAATPVAPAVTPPTTDDSQDKAAKALAMAKNYIVLQKYDLAKPKLQKIVETYPATPAAREAKALLVEIGTK